MSVIHFATELTGGAGSVVRNIHLAMQDMGLPSFVITRERNDLSNSVTVKPLTRIGGALRARGLTVLDKLGVINTSYAMYGIERSPVGLNDIQQALGSRTPTTFIFYWVSYFVNFETILKLRQAYPGVPFVFVCLDEAFLTAGCHYSCGCLGYQQACNNCPASSLRIIKNRIERGFRQRQDLVSAIKPIVIYPTTNIQRMGKKSAVLGKALSFVMPIGAVSNKELSFVTDAVSRKRKDQKGILRLLVRSSSEYRKGCDLFVAAIKSMSVKVPDLIARLEVVSIGDETLADAQIGKYVNHVSMGYVKREELMTIYQDIDALIVTSREDAGPLMINECVALGVFVISTPIGVAGDLIIEKQNGLIAQGVSGDAISDSLTEFLNNYKTAGTEIANVAASQVRRSSLTFEGFVRQMIDVMRAS